MTGVMCGAVDRIDAGCVLQVQNALNSTTAPTAADDCLPITYYEYKISASQDPYYDIGNEVD